MSNNKSFDFNKMSEEDFINVKKENGLGLILEEFRMAQERLERPLTITETYILDSLWSDHCSYKNAKRKLEELKNVKNKHVFFSEKSDAGAVEIPNTGYVCVFKIESHNHPTQDNPYDGAATGVGGILRDIFAMGAEVIGVGGSLRTGPAENAHSKKIIKDAMKGASDYSKIMEIPLIDLDLYCDESFKTNCLMNVTAIGISKKEDIIPNVVPKDAVNYNLIYIGKASAGAAVGGASFASQSFQEEETKKEIEFGSNPSLEKATFNVFNKLKEELRKKGLYSEISMKDMGAAGLTCSTVEQVAARGYGCLINTDKIPKVKRKEVSALELAVGEDQERNMIIASPEATKVILDIFNNDENFKKHGGKVAVIGKVIDKDMFVMYNNENVYCDMPATLITNAPIYEPKSKNRKIKAIEEFNVEKPENLEETIVNLIGSKNIYSKNDIYKVFDTELDYVITKPNETDVSVIAPLLNKDGKQKKKGVALVFGGKSVFGRNGTSRQQAYLSTVLARLKLAVSGLKPLAAVDGCNYGNPENPYDYNDFEKGIDGLIEACKIPLYNEDEPLAVVAGNVSLRNTYVSKEKESAIDPSLIPAVLGYIENYENVVTTGLKKADNLLYLVGKIKMEFRGSEYANMHKKQGKNLPFVSPEEAGRLEYAALEAVENGLLKSAKIIENGGIAAALSKMILTSKEKIGAELELDSLSDMREDYALFSESIGYVLEADKSKAKELEKLYSKYGLDLIKIGKTTTEKSFSAKSNYEKRFEIPISRLEKAFNNSIKF